MKYSVGDYVAVKMTYEKTELCKNSDGVIDVRVVGHTVRVVSDIIESICESGAIYCKNTGLVGAEQISASTPAQVEDVQVAIQGVSSMLESGHNLVSSLNEPEYL